MSAARRWASGPTGGALAGGQRAVEDEWNEFVADLAPSGELAGEEEPVDRQGERHLRSEISLDWVLEGRSQDPPHGVQSGRDRAVP
jgi:hypothetical protein